MLRKGDAQIVVRTGMIRFEAQRTPIMLLGLQQPAFASEQVSQIVEGIDLRRKEPQHMTKTIRRFRQGLLVFECQAQLFECIDAIGIKPQRLAETVDGRAELARLRQHRAEVDAATRVRRV